MKNLSTAGLALRICFLSSLELDTGTFPYLLFFSPPGCFIAILAFPFIFARSSPVFLTLIITLPMIRRFIHYFSHKIYLLILVCFLCSCIYGLIGLLLTTPWSAVSGNPWSDGIKVAGSI